MLNLIIFIILIVSIVALFFYKPSTNNDLQNEIGNVDYNISLKYEEQIFNEDIFLELDLSQNLKSLCQKYECFLTLETKQDSEFKQVSAVYNLKDVPKQYILIKKFLDHQNIKFEKNSKIRAKYEIYAQDQRFYKYSLEIEILK